MIGPISAKKAVLLLMVAVLANARLNQPYQQALLSTDESSNGFPSAVDQVHDAENDIDVADASKRRLDDNIFDNTPQVTHRIVGGVEAQRQRYPYFASIYQRVGKRNVHVCGGTLIHDDIVLSAAHCAEHARKVRVGAYTALDDTTNGNQVYHDSDVKEQIVHPNFYKDELNRLHNDFVLLRLATPVTHPKLLNSMMRLDKVKAADSKLKSGNSVTTIGLGRLEENGSVPNVLHEVELKYKTNDQCSRYFGKVPEEMMCAKDLYQDACNGDSGGPLIVTGNSADEDVPVGVISWGSGCAEVYPGVYARISTAVDWIDEKICENSAVRPKDCPDAPCEDKSHCQFYNFLLPGIWCHVNEDDCPLMCGKCSNPFKWGGIEKDNLT